jgi:hypothetical protein
MAFENKANTKRRSEDTIVSLSPTQTAHLLSYPGAKDSPLVAQYNPNFSARKEFSRTEPCQRAGAFRPSSKPIYQKTYFLSTKNIFLNAFSL